MLRRVEINNRQEGKVAWIDTSKLLCASEENPTPNGEGY